MSEPGYPSRPSALSNPEQSLHELLDRREELRISLDTCTRDLEVKRRELENDKEALARFEKPIKDADKTLRIRIGWMEFEDRLKDARKDVAAVSTQVASLERQRKTIEREFSEVEWQIDALSPEKPPEYNPLDPPEEHT